MIEVGTFRPVTIHRPLGWWGDFITRRFHAFYYRNWKRGPRHGASPATLSLHWLGYELIKCPLDLWTYQEILVEHRPDFVIETGTYKGGSALYLACVMDMLGHGRVLTVDVEDFGGRPAHPRIKYFLGSSVDSALVGDLRREVGKSTRCLVILDSDHKEEHVARELRIYRDFVPVGGYMIVEDTNVNGHPAFPKHGPGPMEAVRAFLAEDCRFEPDLFRERFLLTMNPHGFLRRTG